MWRNFTANIEQSIASMGGALKEIETIDLSAFRRAALEQEEAAARQALTEKQLADTQRERAILNTKLNKLMFEHEETGQMLISDQQEYNRLIRASTFDLERRQRQERAALERQISTRRAEEERKTKADRIRIEQAREMTRLAMGESQIRIDLEKAQAAERAAVKAGHPEEVERLGEIIVKLNAKLKTTKRTRTVSRQNTAEIRARIELQERANALALTGTEQQKRELELEKKRAKVIAEASVIRGKDLREDFERVHLRAIEIEAEQKLLEIANEKTREAQDAFELAERDFDLAFALTDEERIRLQLKHAISDIEAESLSKGEENLRILTATLDAERQLEEERKERLAEQAEGVGGILGGAFGEMSTILGDLDQQLDELNRPKRFEGIMKGFAGIAAQSNEIAGATAAFMTSFGKGQEEVAKGAAAALGSIGPAVAGFVSGTVEKALVMSAFELAMGVATSFVNPAESVSHFTAAGMFAAMAGVSASMPTTALPEATQAAGGGLITPAAAPSEMEAQRITVNLGPGMIMGLPQDLGRAISEQINSMAGTGMESTAF